MKKPNLEKKPIKPIKILKKLTGSVRFRFYKLETKKNRTEPNPNRKKPIQNRAKPGKIRSNRKNRAKPVWTGFFLKN